MTVKWMAVLALTVAGPVSAQVFPAVHEALAAAERCELSDRLDCNRERVAWAEAFGEALGADSARAGELCKLPLTAAAKDLCKPADMFHLGIKLGQMTYSQAGKCLNDGETTRTCQERTLRRYAEILAEHGRELPVPVEPGFAGSADDVLVAQLLAESYCQKLWIR